MTLTTKQKKKLTRILTDLERKQNIMITEIVTQYFVLFCVILLFDQIAGKVFFPYINFSRGIGFMQYALAGFALIQMVRYARMIK